MDEEKFVGDGTGVKVQFPPEQKKHPSGASQETQKKQEELIPLVGLAMGMRRR